jgi:hypothetical protein
MFALSVQHTSRLSPLYPLTSIFSWCRQWSQWQKEGGKSEGEEGEEEAKTTVDVCVLMLDVVGVSTGSVE